MKKFKCSNRSIKLPFYCGGEAEHQGGKNLIKILELKTGKKSLQKIHLEFFYW